MGIPVSPSPTPTPLRGRDDAYPYATRVPTTITICNFALVQCILHTLQNFVWGNKTLAGYPPNRILWVPSFEHHYTIFNPNSIKRLAILVLFWAN